MPENEFMSELYVSFGTGNEVKSLGDGKFGGYLCRFSGPKDPDLEGDFFTKSTEFGVSNGSSIPIFYQHGMDGTLKTRRIGRALVKFDDVGIWLEAQLEARDEYEKMIEQMASDGKLGLSSGAAGHLVEREPLGKAWWIKTWIIAEGSLTPTPAEPRNMVIPLKSYLGDNTTATPEPEGDPEAVKTAESEGKEEAESILPNNQGVKTMDLTKEEIQTLIVDSGKEAVKQFRESEPAEVKADIKITKDEADQSFKTVGEFFMAVKNAAYRPGSMDKRLTPLQETKATGLNEATPSGAGFLVPHQVAGGIFQNMWKTGSVLAQFNPMPVTGNSMTFNVVDETSRADGSRMGGVRGYWLAEGASKTASAPKFRQLELKLKKVAALVYATDEQLEDAPLLEAWINKNVPDELRFVVEDAIVNGDGIGKPLGILSSPALHTFARVDASEIDATDIGKMWAARLPGYTDYIWLGNQGIFSQLLNLSIGNFPVFLPPSGMSGLPYATLLGRPYFDSEYSPALGNIGDLLLFSPSAYPMIDKGGVQSASSIHVAFLTDESVFRFVYRIDGAPLLNSTITGKDSGTYSAFVALTSSS